MKPSVKLKLLLLLVLVPGPMMQAQDSESINTFPSTGIYPGPEPFSLDARSAVYCIDLLRNNPLLKIKNEEGKSGILKVETVWSWFLEFDEDYPKGHRRRYDIIVNGTPLDWDNISIEYGGEMINLRLLFLYRNQYPPEDLQYRGD